MPSPKPKRKPPADAPAILDSVGVEFVCDELMNGKTFTTLAKQFNVSRSALLRWIDASEDRSARVRETRIKAAAVWDEMAEEEIRLAGDPFELTRARELAHHFRWRAAKIAPKDYGDKKDDEANTNDVNIVGGLPD